MKKKKLIIILSLLLIVLIVTIPRLIMPHSWIGTRIYQGNRITINLHIDVDGKVANITKTNSGFQLKTTDYGAIIFDRANNYDTYQYDLLINNSIPVTIKANHWNWWEITKSDVYISIDTNSGTYTISEDYRYTKEQPTYHIEKIHEDKIVVDRIDSVLFYIGPKG